MLLKQLFVPYFLIDLTFPIQHLINVLDPPANYILYPGANFLRISIHYPDINIGMLFFLKFLYPTLNWSPTRRQPLKGLLARYAPFYLPFLFSTSLN